MKSIKNTKKHSSHKKVIVVAAILFCALSALVIYEFRNQIKRSYYESKARSSLTKKIQTLDGSLTELGIKDLNDINSNCLDELIYGVPDRELQCAARRESYIVIGNDPAAKARVISAAKKLDTLLQKDGWETTSNSASTMTEWFTGITSGKDYSTDIDSIKNTSSSHCSLIFNVAYSLPKPPAFQFRMSCVSPKLKATENKAGI